MRTASHTTLADPAAAEVLEAIDLLGIGVDRGLVFRLAWWICVLPRGRA